MIQFHLKSENENVNNFGMEHILRRYFLGNSCQGKFRLVRGLVEQRIY